MQCSSCGCENRAGAKFYNECATPLPLSCPVCGTENRPGAKFCNECAEPLTAGGGGRRAGGGIRSPQRTSKRTQRGRTKDQPRVLTQPESRSSDPLLAEAERRQLTVMFCDLVGSTMLSEQLDPEELREVVLAYQEACAQVIRRFEGYLARYVGDGLLVYFGYPQAHKDEAQRAVRAGLGIVAAMQTLFLPNIRLPYPLQVRIGIHTGLMVAGDMGGGGYRDPLAIMGETPNLAARLQCLAEPDTVVISATTYRSVEGFFACRSLGSQTLKGISTPVEVHQVLGESGIQSRFERGVSTGLMPLVGREQEMGLLLERWERAKEGNGQVVLLSGEAGSGKSRLVRVLREQTGTEPHARVEWRCSPYYQNSALYPVIEQLQRLLEFRREDAPEEKLGKLEQARYLFKYALIQDAAYQSLLKSKRQQYHQQIAQIAG